MLQSSIAVPSSRDYSRAIESSKRARWELDADVVRGRSFSRSCKFLPGGLSLVARLSFLSESEQLFYSQVQGRTYANLFGLIERYINAKMLELTQRHVLGDQVALEALVRFSDEELKHQALFRRIESLASEVMPQGYRCVLDANEVATAVLGKPTWSVLALTFLIELFTQVHYKQSIAPDEQLSELFKDVFRFHWMEESQHSLLDELEWRAEDRKLNTVQREEGVTGLIDLVGAVDDLLRLQATADAEYFIRNISRVCSSSERRDIDDTFLAAYRYQYIVSGVRETRFLEVLGSLLSAAQLARIQTALAPLLAP